MDAETKAKEEALRIKKKIESNINELEIALDHANKANAEAAKQVSYLISLNLFRILFKKDCVCPIMLKLIIEVLKYFLFNLIL